MTACLTSDPDRSSKADALMSLTGIGLRTACFLIAGLPELGLMERGRSPNCSASRALVAVMRKVIIPQRKNARVESKDA